FSRDVRGVKTPAVKGQFTLAEALDRMLADTGLVARFDERSDTFAVRREIADNSKNVSGAIAGRNDRPEETRMERTRSGELERRVSENGGAVELPKFIVTEDPANPYQSSQAVSTSRIAVPIQDIPQ